MDGKPLGVAIEELTETLIHEINASGLPAYIVDLIMLKIQLQVAEASKMQLEDERGKYNTDNIVEATVE